MPTTSPPPAARRKSPAITAADTDPEMAAMAARRQISAVASLTRDSLKDGDNPARHPHLPCDGGRGHRIRRRHHRAQGDRGDQRDLGEQPPDNKAHCDGSEDDIAHGEQSDGAGWNRNRTGKSAAPRRTAAAVTGPRGPVPGSAQYAERKGGKNRRLRPAPRAAEPKYQASGPRRSPHTPPKQEPEGPARSLLSHSVRL